MISKTIEYSVQRDEITEVLSAIKDFLKAIKENEPETVYDAFQKKNSNRFIHIMKFKDEKSEKRHRIASYTQKFVDIIYPLCETEPFFTDLKNLG